MSRQILSPDDRPDSLGWAASEPLEEVAPRLREWTRQVEAFLALVPPIEIVTLRFVGGSTDLEVRTNRPPIAVAVAGVLLDETPGAPISVTPSIDWLRSDGGFRIRSMQGLTTDTAYRVTLVAIGELDGTV